MTCHHHASLPLTMMTRRRPWVLPDGQNRPHHGQEGRNLGILKGVLEASMQEALGAPVGSLLRAPGAPNMALGSLGPRATHRHMGPLTT